MDFLTWPRCKILRLERMPKPSLLLRRNLKGLWDNLQTLYLQDSPRAQEQTWLLNKLGLMTRRCNRTFHRIKLLEVKVRRDFWDKLRLQIQRLIQGRRFLATSQSWERL